MLGSVCYRILTDLIFSCFTGIFKNTYRLENRLKKVEIKGEI